MPSGFSHSGEIAKERHTASRCTLRGRSHHAKGSWRGTTTPYPKRGRNLLSATAKIFWAILRGSMRHFARPRRSMRTARRDDLGNPRHGLERDALARRCDQSFAVQPELDRLVEAAASLAALRRALQRNRCHGAIEPQRPRPTVAAVLSLFSVTVEVERARSCVGYCAPGACRARTATRRRIASICFLVAVPSPHTKGSFR